MITSTSNQQLKNLAQLQTKSKVRNKEKQYVVEGIKMYEEIRTGQPDALVKTFFAESFYNELSTQQPNLFAGLNEIDYEVVSDKVFKEVSDTITPQGVLAIAKQPEHSMEEMLAKEDVNLILLENLRDPGNLGTIIRTAEAAGVTGIILSKESVDIFNPKVIRSTMGAIYRVPFVYVDDFKETLDLLKEKQVSLYATHLHAKNFYDEAVYAKRTGVLIGNEANGLSDEAAKKADELIKIPMEGKVESLNAGVATAIVMYEIYRQKRSH